MSAASRLWRRAPLWRLTIYGSVFFAALMAFYPAPYLLRAIPALSRLHPAGSGSHGPQSGSGSGDAAAAPQPGAAGGPGDGSGRTKVTLQPLTQSLVGSVPLAGYPVPLPAGTWHPVMSAESGPHNAILSQVYVRTDRGVVTGLIMATGTAQPAPDPDLMNLDAPCHDDRLYARGTLQLSAKTSACWAIGTVLIGPTDHQNDALLQAAVQRLAALGYPMPPLFFVTRWIHLNVVDNKGVSVRQIDTMVSPAGPGTTRMPAPLDQWIKGKIGNNPDTARFFDHMQSWSKRWVSTLEQVLDGKQAIEQIAPDAIRDPASPSDP